MPCQTFFSLKLECCPFRIQVKKRREGTAGMKNRNSDRKVILVLTTKSATYPMRNTSATGAQVSSRFCRETVQQSTVYRETLSGWSAKKVRNSVTLARTFILSAECKRLLNCSITSFKGKWGEFLARFWMVCRNIIYQITFWRFLCYRI